MGEKNKKLGKNGKNVGKMGKIQFFQFWGDFWGIFEIFLAGGASILTPIWWQTTFAFMLWLRNEYKDWELHFWGDFGGIFANFGEIFEIFLAGGASILTPIWWQTTFAFMLWLRNEYKDWELHFWGDFGGIFANFGEIFEIFLAGGASILSPILG